MTNLGKSSAVYNDATYEDDEDIANIYFCVSVF